MVFSIDVMNGVERCGEREREIDSLGLTHLK
jgi:hypothetical protein